MIRNEIPHETYLEIAMYYVNLSLTDDALRVLEAAPEQATVRYWQAYLLREKSPEQSREMLGQAAALSPYLVFPFREESVPVFEWAAHARPGDWKAKYYLGLVYWGLRRQDEALKMLSECGRPARLCARLHLPRLARAGCQPRQGAGRLRESARRRPERLEKLAPPGQLLRRARHAREGA